MSASPYQLERWRLLGLLPQPHGGSSSGGEGVRPPPTTRRPSRGLCSWPSSAVRAKRGRSESSSSSGGGFLCRGKPCVRRSVGRSVTSSGGTGQSRTRSSGGRQGRAPAPEPGDFGERTPCHRRVRRRSLATRPTGPRAPAPGRPRAADPRRDLRRVVDRWLDDRGAPHDRLRAACRRLEPVLIRAELEGVREGPSVQSLLQRADFDQIKATRTVAHLCQNLFFLIDSAVRVGEQRGRSRSSTPGRPVHSGGTSVLWADHVEPVRNGVEARHT